MGASAVVVNRYLDAFTNGDLAKARSVVADDFSFIGSMLQAKGIDAYSTAHLRDANERIERALEVST